MFDLAGFDLAPIQEAVAATVRVIAGARTGVSQLSMSMKPFAPICRTLPVSNDRIGESLQRTGFGDTVKTPSGGTGRIRVEGTWNTENLAELVPHASDIIVTKRR